MEASPLQKLPPELRNEIYGLTLQANGEIPLEQNSDRSRHRLKKYALELTLVCKQVRSESLSVFYAVNTLCFDTHLFDNWQSLPATPSTGNRDQLDPLRSWLNKLNYASNCALRRVNITLGTLRIRGDDEHSWDESYVVSELLKTIKIGHSKKTVWATSLWVDYTAVLHRRSDLQVLNLYDVNPIDAEDVIDCALRSKRESTTKAKEDRYINAAQEGAILANLEVAAGVTKGFMSAIVERMTLRADERL